MRLLHSLLAAAALMGLTLAAHATTDTTFTVKDGKINGGGTFSGTYTLDASTDLIDGGTISYIAANGGSETFTYAGSKPSKYGSVGTFFGDTPADVFSLATSTSTTSPTLCLLGAACGESSTYVSLSFVRSGATAGTISGETVPPVAATPEPSSLILLGTGFSALPGRPAAASSTAKRSGLPSRGSPESRVHPPQTTLLRKEHPLASSAFSPCQHRPDGPDPRRPRHNRHHLHSHQRYNHGQRNVLRQL